MRTVSLMTANQQFSRLIREVEGGEDIVITRRGRPVARLVPHREDKTADPEWAAAYERMMARLEQGVSLGGLSVRRDELYDR
ncbi:MAG: type II toxin-antitoxin system prevent-host-death family antitoxin [Defluviicoccus sp.]|nr:type II toxin-antitoxin system prevent-host-death family antitoxin [Defluviicoccus sp.]MDE0386315.1 type II toxin-antitoxin system prevent-host-death family antitoxin [Defluviicoccus sp.]